ncbi:exodeoxyribonuclease V subunit beta [Halothiobacillus neapolitanus]|nr:exodeoxyribonuclease V subunit beta [Halothiobacillus neapolitanus]
MPLPLNPLTFPFAGSRLIEASAGTGKTFTIALLYVRLVLGHGTEPLMPPQILVTTFTDAAADELRDRIRARLFEAYRIFSEAGSELDPIAVDPYLLDLRAAFPTSEERLAAARRLEMAANWMDEAAIFTIHGWCQRMLNEHAFHSRALFEQTVRTSLTPVVDQAVQDYWRHYIYALPPAQALSVANLLGGPSALTQKLNGLLSRDGAPLFVDGKPVDPAALDFFAMVADIAELDTQAQQAEQDARQAWSKHAETLKDAWLPIMSALSGTSHRTLSKLTDFSTLWDSLDLWAQTGEPLPIDVFKFLTQPKFNKKLERPFHPALAVFSAWPVAMEAARHGREQSAIRLLAHAAFWVRDRIDTVLQQNAEMGFDDILLNLDRALTGAEGQQLADTIRTQFPVAMIDEFQDTDPLQYRIFDRVFRIGGNGEAAGQAGTMILIGDPKQSIYRFRGADMFSYLAAREATQGRHYTLDANYRSTPELVAAVNYVFERADRQPSGAFGHKTDEGNPLPFIRVSARGKARRLQRRNEAGEWQPCPPLTGWALPRDSLLAAGHFVEQMAEHTAEAITSSLNAAQVGDCAFFDAEGAMTALRPQDIAILVSTGDQAAVLQQSLIRRGIKSVYLSDRHRLFATEEAADFHRWLLAIAEPQRQDRLRAALGSSSFARHWGELDAVRNDARLDEDTSRFMAYQRITRHQGILAAVYQLMHDYHIPARLLAAPLPDRSGERRLTNLLHLADWAQNEQAQLAGLDALLQRYAQAVSDNEAEHELRLEQDEHLVRIITIHSAKGLQYPVVYLPFLPLIRPKEANKNSTATPWRTSTGRGMSLGEFPEAIAAEHEAQMTESVRLIYVALTRAESACTLALGPVKFGAGKQPNQHESGLGHVLRLQGNDEFIASFEAALTDLDAQAGVTIEPPPSITHARFVAPVEDSLPPARTAKRRVDSHWRISSFSGLTHALHESDVAVPETAKQEQLRDVLSQTGTVEESLDLPQTHRFDPQSLSARISHLPRGTTFGTLLHSLLERAGEAGFNQSANFEFSLNLVRQLASTLTEDQQSTLAELVLRILTLSLVTTPSRRLADVSRYQIEQEFWLPVAQTQTSSIDALLCAHVHPGQMRPLLTAQYLEGQIKGFMDLVFEADGRFYILDYKSNWLGDSPEDYAPEHLVDAMLAARYDLQMVLYLTALHRHLQDRLPNYDPAVHLGGALYLFVRGIDSPGQGVYFSPANPTVIAAMDALLMDDVSPNGAHPVRMEAWA